MFTPIRNYVEKAAFVLCAAGAFVPAFAVKEIPASSQIETVVIYTDRAQVTRTWSLNLPAGATTVVFGNLPEQIDANSVSVNGTGAAVLRDVAFGRTRMNEDPDSRSKDLLAEKDRWQDSLRLTEDRARHAASEKAFVESIAARMTRGGSDSSGALLDPAKWIKMVDFYRSRTEALDREIFNTERRQRDIQDRINKVNAQIGDLGRADQRSRNQVSVLVDMKTEGKASLTLSYVVYGPSWIPSYELRVSGEKKILSIAFNGMVRQNTGEDWDNVNLKLSTARPQVGGTQPDMSPWHIRLWRPVVSRRAEMQAPKMMAMEKISMAKASRSRSDDADEMEESPAPAPMVVEEAAVETGASAVVFAPASRATVKSDNEAHRVAITTRELDAAFSYSSTPRLSPYAYLKARAKNTSEYPFLQGQAAVFLDNHFVATSTLKPVAPKEEFDVYLGVDEAVRVERKELKRYEKNDGLVAKRKRIIFEYAIEINNTRKEDADVTLLDQVPISDNEEIKIELIDPAIKENSDKLKRTPESYLEWKLKLKAGQKTSIPLKFSVEYPADKRVEGM